MISERISKRLVVSLELLVAQLDSLLRVHFYKICYVHEDKFIHLLQCDLIVALMKAELVVFFLIGCTVFFL